MKEYYCDVGGQVVGLVTRDDLSGLDGDSKVCEVDTKAWFLLKSIDRSSRILADVLSGKARAERVQLAVRDKKRRDDDRRRAEEARRDERVRGEKVKIWEACSTAASIPVGRALTETLGLVSGNAVVGVSIDYETVGIGMLMIVATGTAALVG